jgi:hypothetical protein
MSARTYAKDSDCADCGQSEAGFKFRGTDSICEGCAPQYQDEDLTPVVAEAEETCHCAACEGFY